MKNIQLFATLAIVSVFLFAACKKDTFVEVPGVCPIVISTTPANDATGVSLNQIITVTFNEAMNPATITQASFIVQGAGPIAGTVSYTGTTATFTPSDALTPNSTYTARVKTSVKDLTGNALQADYVWSFTTGTGFVDLKSVGRFGIIGGVSVNNNAGKSEIHNMDVGVIPGLRASITGFPPAILVNGAIYAPDDITVPGVAAMLLQAKQDLTEAYLFAEKSVFPAPVVVSGDLGGTTLLPGNYKSLSTLLIQSGDLTLNAQGDTSAIWVFQIASDLTTIGGAGGNIILSGGAQAKNVFWQVGNSATIGDFTAFKGTVLALTSITMKSGATADGRLLARNGSVVLTSTNIIRKP